MSKSQRDTTGESNTSTKRGAANSLLIIVTVALAAFAAWTVNRLHEFDLLTFDAWRESRRVSADLVQIRSETEALQKRLREAREIGQSLDESLTPVRQAASQLQAQLLEIRQMAREATDYLFPHCEALLNAFAEADFATSTYLAENLALAYPADNVAYGEMLEAYANTVRRLLATDEPGKAAQFFVWMPDLMMRAVSIGRDAEGMGMTVGAMADQEKLYGEFADLLDLKIESLRRCLWEKFMPMTDWLLQRRF